MSVLVLAGMVLASFIAGVACAVYYLHPHFVALSDAVETATRGRGIGRR